MFRVAPEDLGRLVQQRWRCHGHLETAVEVIHGGGSNRRPSPCILYSRYTVFLEGFRIACSAMGLRVGQIGVFCGSLIGCDVGGGVEGSQILCIRENVESR